MKPKLDIQYCQEQLALHNDKKAYKALFIHFYASLCQFALSIVKNEQLAEEVVSDVFLKVWQNRSGLMRIQDMKLYLFTATKNTALNYWRSHSRMLQHTESKEAYQVQVRSIYYDPEQLMLTSEMIHRIQQAISQLPPRCQLIFKLVKEDGLKYKDVAALLNLSVKTVENQMTLALKKIGEAIPFDIRKVISIG